MKLNGISNAKKGRFDQRSFGLCRIFAARFGPYYFQLFPLRPGHD